MSETKQGTVKWFNTAKVYGFIDPDNVDKAHYYCSRSHVLDIVPIGDNKLLNIGFNILLIEGNSSSI